MQTGEKKYISVDILTYIFVSLLMFAWFDHLCRFFSSMLFQGQIHNGLCIALGAALFLVFTYFSLKRTKVYAVQFDKIDLLLLSIGILYLLAQLPFFDSSYDLIAHDLGLQQDAFKNLATYDFMRLSDKSGMYALGNRVYYYFRMLFGYRMMIAVNFVVYFTVYYKAKELLYTFAESLSLEGLNKHILAPVISLFAVLCEFFVSILFITKTDTFLAPLYLECIRLAFFKKNLTKYDYGVAGLLIGLSMGIKYSMLIPYVSLVLILLWKERKQITVQHILYAGVACCAISSIYIIFNWVTLGNPVFPFYNHIFKSDYMVLDKMEWDFRWGPKTFLETIFWPVLCFFIPERASELPFDSGRLAIGYIIGIVYFAAALRSKNKKIRSLMHPVAAMLGWLLVWSMVAGYSRYTIGLDIYIGVIIGMIVFVLYDCYLERAKQKRYTTAKNYIVTASFVFLILSAQFLNAQKILVIDKMNWNVDIGIQRMNEYVQTGNWKEGLRYYWDNCKFLFRDRGHVVGDNKEEIEQELEKVDIWIDRLHYGYYTLLNSKADVFMGTFVTRPEFAEIKLNMLKEAAKTKNIYAVNHAPLGDEDLEEYFKSIGLVIEKKFTFTTDFYYADEPFTLYRLRLREDKLEEVGWEMNEMNAKPLVSLSIVPGREEALFDLFGDGLSGQEEDGMWTDKKTVLLPVYVGPIDRDKTLTLTAASFGNQLAKIFINGNFAGEYSFEGRKTVEIPVQKDWIGENGVMDIKIELPNADISPMDLGEQGDGRKLGLKLHQLDIADAL